jgi:hypothetical protein
MHSEFPQSISERRNASRKLKAIMAVGLIALTVGAVVTHDAGAGAQIVKPMPMRANVRLDYHYHMAADGALSASNTTTAYNGDVWRSTTKDGLLLFTKKGLRLKLVKHETFIRANIVYGTNKPWVFKKIWSGKNTVAFVRKFKVNGHSRALNLTDVHVLAYKANQPLPPAKK